MTSGNIRDALFAPILGIGLILFAVVTLTYSTRRSDFLQDYAAAYSWRHHLPLYGDAGDELSERFDLVRGQYNAHPPTNAVLFIPLSYLSPRAAFIGWNLVELSLLFAIIRMTSGECGFSWMQVRTGAAAVLLWAPFLSNTGLGQTGAILSAGVLWAWRLLKRGRHTAAGAVLGVVVLLKVFPLLFVIFLAATRRWRTLAALVFVTAAGLVLTWLIVGTDVFAAYVFVAAPKNTTAWITSPLNWSIPGTVAILSRPGTWAATALPQSAAAPAALSLCAAAVAVTAHAAMKRRDCQAAQEQCFLAFTIAMLMVSPLTWSHSFLVAIWPAAVLVRDSGRYPLWGTLIAAAACVALSIPQVMLIRAVLATAPVSVPMVLLLRLPAFGLVALWLVFYTRARCSSTPGPFGAAGARPYPTKDLRR